jgi:hypothetical protein
LSHAVINRKKMKVEDIITDFRQNLTDFLSKTGVNMKIMYHAKVENFEGQYYNIHVSEDNMRRKNP